MNKHVNEQWEARIKQSAELYYSLKYSTRLKLATSTYLLQSTRAAFNQTVKHFLAECGALEDTRQPVIEELQPGCSELLPEAHVRNDIVQIILDPSRLIPMKRGAFCPKQIDVYRQAKRLCHSLHLERYQKLAIIPSRKMKRHKRTDAPRHTTS